MDQVQECAICLEPIYEPSGDSQVDSVITPCQHKFHLSCLKYWIDLKQNYLCPDCKQPIPPIAE
ncbi:hypothetical protein pb186bvf_013505 [Paramecium bursaria]